MREVCKSEERIDYNCPRIFAISNLEIQEAKSNFHYILHNRIYIIGKIPQV